MDKKIKYIRGIFLIIAIIVFNIYMTPGTFAGDAEIGSIESICQKDPKRCAKKPSECKSKPIISEKDIERPPDNCMFLEEPIGGRPNYDLFVINCYESDNKTKRKSGCKYTLWDGSHIPKYKYGPVQAILTFSEDKPYQGPLGLLYNYLSLIYKYMSGLIVGLVVLFVIVGGIQMTTSAGDTGKFDEGKNRIIKAIVGMILWFLASLILYTINPTFFAF